MQADGCRQEGLLEKSLLPSPTNQSLHHNQPPPRPPTTHRRQKASVPKCRSMVPSSALARGRRSGTCPTSKFFM